MMDAEELKKYHPAIVADKTWKHRVESLSAEDAQAVKDAFWTKLSKRQKVILEARLPRKHALRERHFTSDEEYR